MRDVRIDGARAIAKLMSRPGDLTESDMDSLTRVLATGLPAA